MLEDALVGPMERWRQFELALALSMAEEISRRTSLPMRLKSILPTSLDSLIEIGSYIVRWQKAAPSYIPPALDDWEARAEEIAKSYGLSPGHERPDVVVYDRDSGVVLAIGEAKYFENESWRERLWEATLQIVMYARGYESTQDAENLIRRSIIALLSAGDDVASAQRAPIVTTFSEIRNSLKDWGNRCFGAPEALEN
jgi:hypothetical protein